MYLIILKFVKDKMFTPTSIILFIFIAIFALFAFSNADTIMTKMGFETKTSLKGKLVQARADLKTMSEVNADLISEITRLEEDQKLTLEVIEEVYVKKQETIVTVERVIAERDKQDTVNRVALKTATVITDVTITMPKLLYERASKSNIEALHNAFAALN